MESSRKASPEEHASDPQPRLSPYTIEAVHALSYIRIIAGAGFLFAPTISGRLFQIAIAPRSLESTLARLLGASQVVLGDLTWFKRPRFNTIHTESERRELRHILWANVASDALEGGIILYAASAGIIPKTAALYWGSATVAFLAMGLLTGKKI